MKKPVHWLTITLLGITLVALAACDSEQALVADSQKAETAEVSKDDFKYQIDRFDDVRVLRYKVPGFEQTSLPLKKLAYYLYRAALAGRDITYDQNYKHNLTIRRTLEEIIKYYSGDRSAAAYQKLERYTKHIWFASGIHHHYSNGKFLPEFSYDELLSMLEASPGQYPLLAGENKQQLAARLKPILFDPAVDAKKVNKAKGIDQITESAVNFYEGVTAAEVENFYAKRIDSKDKTPPSHGLNSKLVKENGQVVEKVWKIGGMYSEALEQIVFWLEKALTVTENDKQNKALAALIKYFKSGDLKDFDAYNIAWVEDTESKIDTINGFIEVYNDPKGFRGSYEALVQLVDPIASERIADLATKAQWFEDHSTIEDKHKKQNVKGISARAINVLVESGDASPSTPIGINLPNANWIRAEHGSKSVSLGNIVSAYHQARGKSLEEFAYSKQEIALSKQHGKLAGALHTDMHEVIGHASGKLNEGVGTPKETLKSYASTLEEGRADLVALYFLMDPQLVEWGVVPSLDVGRVEYDGYIRNGLLVQLSRIKPGDDIEEAHMRNRQMVAAWCYEKGAKDNVIEKKIKEGKTYYVVNDYLKLRQLFGQLLRELQRIKSEGDYQAGQALVEGYGVKVDQDLHKEVLVRYAKLNQAPYAGFVNPRLVPVMENDEIIDVRIEYPDDFKAQMLFYAENYSLLPNYNG